MRARIGASVLAGVLLSASGLVLASASATATDDNTSTTSDTRVTYDVQQNDTANCNISPGNEAVYSAVYFANQSQLISTQEGEWEASEGSITFTPAAGFTGTASVEYFEDCYEIAEDQAAQYRWADSATFTVEVGPAAEIPIVSAPVAGAAAALAALVGGVWLVRRRGTAA